MRLIIEHKGAFGIGGVRRESAPFGLNNSKFSNDIETGFLFFRKKIETELSFFGQDWDLLRGLESYTCCTRIILYFYRDCDDDDHPYFSGYFYTNEAEYDYDNLRVIVKNIKTYDVWDFVFKNYEKDINIMDVAVDPNLNYIYSTSGDASADYKAYFNRNRNFTHIISYLVKKTLDGTDFHAYYPENSEVGLVFTMDTSPVTQGLNELKDICFTHGSDFYDPGAEVGAVTLNMNLKTLFENLKSFCGVYPYLDIETNKIRFEHISFFPQEFYRFDNKQGIQLFVIPQGTLSNDNYTALYQQYVQFMVSTKSQGTYEQFKTYVQEKLGTPLWLTNYLIYLDTINVFDTSHPQRAQVTSNLTVAKYANAFKNKRIYSYLLEGVFKRFEYVNEVNNSIFDDFKSNNYYTRVDFDNDTYIFEQDGRILEAFATGNITFESDCTLKDSSGKGQTSKDNNVLGLATNIMAILVKWPQMPIHLQDNLNPNIDIETTGILINLSRLAVTETINAVWERDGNDDPIISSRELTYKLVENFNTDMHPTVLGYRFNGRFSMSNMAKYYHSHEKPFNQATYNSGVVFASLGNVRPTRSVMFTKLVNSIRIPYCCGDDSIDVRMNIKTFAFDFGRIKSATFDVSKEEIEFSFVGASICNEIITNYTVLGTNIPAGTLISIIVTTKPNPNFNPFAIPGTPLFIFECIGQFADGSGGTYEASVPCNEFTTPIVIPPIILPPLVF